MPTILLACLSWLARKLFRFEVSGREHLAACEGGAVLLVNHVSFIDGILLCALPGERPFCAVDYDVGRAPRIHPVIQNVGHCLIDSAHPFGFRDLVKAGRQGRNVAIFPEARISVTGLAMKCYAGAHVLARRTGQPIVHVRIDGAERSTFSYIGALVRQRRFPKIGFTFHPPVEAPEIADRRMQALFLFDQLSAPLRAAFAAAGFSGAVKIAGERVGPAKRALTDNERKPINYRYLSEILESGNKAGGGEDDRTAAGAAHYLAQMDGGSDAHRMVETAAALGTAWDINAGDRVFVACPGGDLLGRTAGLVLPLQRGATVMRYRPRRDTRNLAELLYDFNATILVIAGDALAELDKAHPYDFRSLRMVLTWSDHADDPRLAGFGSSLWCVRRSAADGWPEAATSPFWTFLAGGYRSLESVCRPDADFYASVAMDGKEA